MRKLFIVFKVIKRGQTPLKGDRHIFRDICHFFSYNAGLTLSAVEGMARWSYSDAVGSKDGAMPRTAREVIEDVPYHVTQRGNRRQDVFFSDTDRRTYLSWLRDYSQRYSLDILAYCLMTNHIHLVVIPRIADALSSCIGVINTRYSQMTNTRFGWSGHLWQGRYFSTALDDPHLYAAVRYVERNPVRAGIVKRAEDHPWSSAAFHLGLRKDRLIKSETMWGGWIPDWEKELREPEDEQVLEMIRNRTQRGFPCGDEEFVSELSEILGHQLALRPRGRPRKG